MTQLKIEKCLKVLNEQELIDILPFARITDQDDNVFWRTDTHDYSLDIIGEMYADDAVYSEDGEVITPPTKIEGYFANIVATKDIINTIPEQYFVYPQNRRRVFL